VPFAADQPNTGGKAPAIAPTAVHNEVARFKGV
jgi:hypothetical protein